MRKRNEHKLVLLFVEVDGRRARVVVAEWASVLQKWRGRRLSAVGFRAMDCRVPPVLLAVYAKTKASMLGRLRAESAGRESLHTL